MTVRPRRRDVLAALGAAAALTPGGLLPGRLLSGGLLPGTERAAPAGGNTPLFRISLAQWSLHRTLRSGALDPLDFAAVAKNTYGVDGIEYVNSFFKDKATDFTWLGQLKDQAESVGVTSLLIMIDGEGQLAVADDAARARAVENHFRWIAAASFLGCHAIRVNAAGDGSWDDQRERAAASLHHLAEYGAPYGISVIVENHGGLSSNGKWLAEVMAAADHPGVGTLPDFGNFHLGDGEWYDRYRGVEELMPFAKAVSAKSHAFDVEGDETNTDYRRMLKLVLAAGYHGYIGIEYEGSELSERDGILATRRLLERVRAELAG